MLLHIDLDFLENFETKDVAHSLRDKDAFDKFVENYYKPKEEVDISQLIVYAILKAKINPGSVKTSQYFERVLTFDLLFYLKENSFLERDFIKVCRFLMTRVIQPSDLCYDEIVK